MFIRHGHGKIVLKVFFDCHKWMFLRVGGCLYTDTSVLDISCGNLSMDVAPKLDNDC